MARTSGRAARQHRQSRRELLLGVAQRRRPSHGELEASPVLRSLRALRHPRRHQRNEERCRGASRRGEIAHGKDERLDRIARGRTDASTSTHEARRPTRARGDVLEVTVTVTAQAKPTDRLVVPSRDLVAINSRRTTSSMTSPPQPPDCAGASITRPSKQRQQGHHARFQAREGIDQFGREQSTAPDIQGGPGVWDTVSSLVQQRARHPAAPRPRLQRRQTWHLPSLSRQPPRPSR